MPVLIFVVCMCPALFILSHPQLKLSADAYATAFKVKRNKQNKVNACASNFSDVPMHKLDGIIQEVGGFKLRTPHTHVARPDLVPAKSSEDVKWWWQLLKKTFESAVPENVFDTEDQWNTANVSQMCSPTA